MLTLIEGNVSGDRDRYLEDLIKSTVSEGTRSFLIVPEQETLTRERIMSSILPPSAPLTFEVTNFTRFINTAFRTLGGLSGEYCDSAAKSLIMWRVLTELSPMLTLTRGRAEVTKGSVDRALRAVSEMQSLAILPEDLVKAKDEGGIKDARLSAKISDLYLIYSLYKKQLTEKYGDLTDDTLSLARMLEKDGSYLDGVKIFIDGFTSFTEPQYKLITELIRSADVTVTLALPRGGSKLFEYTELEKTHTRLSTIAGTRLTGKNIVHTDTSGSERSYASALAELIFRTDIDACPIENNNSVRIFSAPTPFEECAFVVSDIRRRVMEGAHYSDFAVIARSCESYTGILDRAFDTRDVPYFFSRTRDISSFEAIKLIHTAYAIIKRGYSREDVITYLKCALSGISKEEADIFELFVETWNIDGYSFVSEDDWCMNPRGYEEFRKSDVETLKLVNSVKDRLMGPLIAFGEDVKSAKTVEEHARALYAFLVKLGLEDKLRERSELLTLIGEARHADENSRLYKIICDSLDRLVTLSGETPADSESFINQFSVVLSADGMGSIPSHIDEVTVGSADMIRLNSKKHVYLIGVNEGKFPSLAQEKSYFSDKDKSELMNAGLKIEPDTLVRSARELYCFVRAMSFADETVTITWCERSAALEPEKPADVIARINELTDNKAASVKIGDMPLYDRIYSKEDAYSLSIHGEEDEKKAINKVLTEMGDELMLAKKTEDVSNLSASLDDEAVALIYKGDLYLSQSKIEKYLACPFAYFLKYNLGLKEQEKAELSPLIVGTFIHSILENFFKEVKNSGRQLSDFTPEERSEITERVAAQYVHSTLGGGYGRERTRVAIKRLSRAATPVIDGMCDEFSECKYVPTLFEVSTDGKEPTDASPIIYECEGENKIIIRGKVDRVDTYKDKDRVFVRVIDYKTGSKVFSPKDLSQGINIQMFLYLKSIVDTDTPAFRESLGAGENDTVVPAGVIYAKTSVNDSTVKHASDEEALLAAMDNSSRDGMVLDDDTSLSAMNPRFTPLKYPEDKRNKPSNDMRKYTADGWSEITSVIEEKVREIAGNMRSGKICPEPLKIKGKSPCRDCIYRPICRRA